jgi:hypothetical protein
MRPDSNTRRATVPKLRLFVDGYTQIYIIIEINKQKKFECRIRDAAAILVFVSSTYFMKEARDGRVGGGGGAISAGDPGPLHHLIIINMHQGHAMAGL